MHESTQAAVRDGIARTLAAVGLGGVALIHLVDLPGKFQETPYLAWMYIGLIAASVATAAALVRDGDRRAWAAALALPLATIAGFVLSRTTGLPAASGDIGNWSEPLGTASLFVEGMVAALAGAVLARLPAGSPVRSLTPQWSLAGTPPASTKTPAGRSG